MSQSVQAAPTLSNSPLPSVPTPPLPSIRSKRRGKLSQRSSQRRQVWQTPATRRSSLSNAPESRNAGASHSMAGR